MIKKTKRPLKFKLDAYRLYCDYLLTPPVTTAQLIKCFEAAGILNGCTLSGCMTTPAYVRSYMADDVRRFLWKKLDQGNEEVTAYFKQHNLLINY